MASEHEMIMHDLNRPWTVYEAIYRNAGTGYYITELYDKKSDIVGHAPGMPDMQLVRILEHIRTIVYINVEAVKGATDFP